MTHARAERAALCDLLDRLGPDAPTLCGGWTTADLAAHLALRERRPDAVGGIAIKLLSGYTESVQNQIKTRRPYGDLVDLVRHGPPKWTPYGFIPGLDEAVNAVELFIHHEDVRRAQPDWEPRSLPADLEDFIWKRLKGGSRLFLRRSPVGVALRRTGGEMATGKTADPTVLVTGDPAELMLFAFGRQKHARVSYEGADEAVSRLRDARLGV